MTSAWFLGAKSSVKQTDNEVRSTVEPVRTDGDTAEADHSPEWNELDTDESGNLVGLTPRMVGAKTNDMEKFSPWWARLVGGSDGNFNAVVDNQVSTSGTAAAREVAGQQGHGSMQYEESLEPVIRTGGLFGNDYFQASDPHIQDGMGSYMTPADEDNWAASVGAATAKKRSRDAYQGTLYQNLFTAG